MLRRSPPSAILVDMERVLPVRVRRRLLPGDTEAIVAQHERLYVAEHGLDASFVAGVADGLAAAVARGWPGAREGVWLVERDDTLAGSLGLTDEGGGTAQLRWFLIEPELRGGGRGRRLLAEALGLAAESGYARVVLDTFSHLTAAAALYRAAGFRAASEQPGPRWGLDAMVFQRYELALPG